VSGRYAAQNLDLPRGQGIRRHILGKLRGYFRRYVSPAGVYSSDSTDQLIAQRS
jgi:hypothetical protein